MSSAPSAPPEPARAGAAAMPSPAPAGASAPAIGGVRHISLGGRSIAFVPPSRSDPRLKLSLVIVSLQVLGQALLNFKVSIAQILVSVAVAAAIDGGWLLRQRHVLVWPASGILTGNGVAFILRATGTQHGQWWSLRGIQYFIAAAAISVLSKHLIRMRGKHVFNPSNVGLVWALLVFGPVRVFPQYLWWGGIGLPVLLALAVILPGAVWVLRAVRMLPMALSFLATFTALVALLAASGQSFIAIWHAGAISGFSYWRYICTSPELMIFVFFMMSDPQTAPRAPLARCIYGAATAVAAAALLSFQTTEFGVKLAILASLTMVCAFVPSIEAAVLRLRSPRAAAREPAAAGAPSRWGLPRPAITPALLAVLIIAVGAVADTAALSGDRQVLYIEQGLTGSHNPQ